jgi:hypothetical protein
MIGEQTEMDREQFEKRRSNHERWEYVDFSESLFTDCFTVAGVRIAAMTDGSSRYVATWKDDRGRDRLSVCGPWGPPAVMYRNLKNQGDQR